MTDPSRFCVWRGSGGSVLAKGGQKQIGVDSLQLAGSGSRSASCQQDDATWSNRSASSGPGRGVTISRDRYADPHHGREEEMSLFRLTLYELFGYLVPGLFCFLSVALLGWTGFTLDLGLHGSVHLSAIQCVAFLLISYILGASVHSLAEWLYGSRWICRVGPATVFSRGTGGVHRELLEKLER